MLKEDDFLKFCLNATAEQMCRELAAGADVNARDSIGRTPLMWAMDTCKSNSSAIEALINMGADENAKDNSGNTAKMIRQKKNCYGGDPKSHLLFGIIPD